MAEKEKAPEGLEKLGRNIDLKMISTQGHAIQAVLTGDQCEIAGRILDVLRGLSINEAAVLLDYVREVINCTIIPER